MADSLLNITVGLAEVPATVTERVLRASEDAASLDGIVRLARELRAAPARDLKVVARVDSVTRGAAAATITVTAADCTAGDTLRIDLPGLSPQTLTAVALDASVVDGANYSLETATDTAVAASLASAINSNALLGVHLTATASSGVVTITAVEAGSWAHSIVMDDTETTSTALVLVAFSGGDDVLAQPSMTVTFGTANIVADDTISIGARVYTWKASASADGEITLSTTPATASTNFAAAVNADATFIGLVTAVAASTVVTLTFVGDPRSAKHISMDYTETNATSIVLGGTVTIGTSEVPVLGSTVTGSSTARTYGGRGMA